MTFVNASLLAGSVLIAVPILLHLIMRQKPRLLEFPALRFLQKRHDTNQRRLRLRHLLLLLLRAGAIGLLALALARPSMKFSSNLGSQESPVAAVLVFDVAPHMQYRHQNQTRLEAARELGLWILGQLPRESQIAVLDTGMVERGFDADRGLSKQRIQRLEIMNSSQPLARVVGEAARVLTQGDLGEKRRELYIFTDLSRAAWPADAAAAIQDRLNEVSGAAIYVIDVGVAEPADFALGEVRLSQQVLSAGGSVDVATNVSAVGASGERTVELHVVAPDRTSQKVGEKTVVLKSGEARPVEFRLSDLKTCTHQGFIRLMGQDGLAADDTRYFTIEVRPAWPVLLVAPRPVGQYAVYWTGAIAPTEYRKRGQARFDCHLIDYGELPGQSLEKDAAVCLLDPPPLEPGVWQKLTDYASEGHGVGVFLGRNAQPVDSFNVPAAQQLLPGKLTVQVPRRDGDNCLAPRDYQHPILRAFSSRATSMPWSAFPVLRYWELADLPAGAGTVVPYSDGRPALVERPIGSGRVLLMTTPVSDRPTRDAWNLLPVSPMARPWPFVILANQIMSYLVGGGQQQLNYFAGQTVVLPLEEAARRRTWLLTAPDNAKTPLSPERQDLTISAVDQVGNYQVQGGGRESGVDRGFSVNLTPEQTRLDRLDESQLAERFGPFKIRLARTADQIDRNVTMGRVGRELYPALILLMAFVLAAEFVVANRFYKGP